MKNKKVHKFPNETNFVQRAATTVKVLCMLLAMTSVTARAQVLSSRSSSVVVSGNPTQNLIWTYNIADYSIVNNFTVQFPGTTPTVTGVKAIATNPVNGDSYCIVASGIFNDIFAKLDVLTGDLTQIGLLNDNFASITFNNNGTCFALPENFSFNPGQVYTLDLNTGAKTPVFNVSTIGGNESIAYCNDNDLIYHWSSDGVNVTFERFDTTGANYTSYPGIVDVDVAGAVYAGDGTFITSNANNQFRKWDTAGVQMPAILGTTALGANRGLGGVATFSSISSTTSTTFCLGGSVDLTVSGATGNYQWYKDGVAIAGATDAVYTADSTGNYNATYTDTLGITDSLPTGINVIANPNPVLTSPLTKTVCNNTALGYVQSGTDVASYRWGRAVQAHISNAAATGTGDINEVLVNDTAVQAQTVYDDTLTSAAGCVSIYHIGVTVNPTLSLFPTPLVPSRCSGQTFHFESTSRTPAADISYSWSRAAVPGNPATSGTGAIIDEALVNNTTAPFTVTYVDTLRAYGCENLQLVQYIVNPVPVLTSTLTPSSICDSALFSYVATSATSGVTTGNTGSITWTRGTVTGISNPAGSGFDTVNEYLDNTLDIPVAVTYVFTIGANGCSNSQTVTVFVNPTPRLNTTLTPASICDSTLFHYTSGSNTIGATRTWSRAAVAGISNAAATGGAGDIDEYLNNTTANPVVVSYVYTLTIDGCSHNDVVKVTVNPTPLISTAAPAPICDSAIFSFAPASLTTGPVTYSWSRPFVSGIVKLPGSGTGNPNEQLINSTNTNVTVAYIYTVTANGCSNTQTINVVVRPTPRLFTDHTDSVCSGVEYNYVPQSLTTGVTYAWSRAAVAGLNPGTRAGSGNIKDTITNTTTTNQIANYVIVLTTGGCTHTEVVSVTVEPAATPAVIAITPGASVCSGSMYQNFGAANEPPAGAKYIWSATNATVLATGTTGQYALVNFENAGTSVVSLSSELGNGCKGYASYTVNVGTSSSPMPYVIYTAGHFVCLQNDVKSFQWGYDDAHSLDSTIVPGAIDQSYFIDGAPDVANRNYWVMTTSNTNDCIKKAYYNVPTGVADVNAGALFTVYPNPATSNVNVEVNANVSGSIRLDVVNMLGQKVATVNTDNHKSVIDVTSFTPGFYIIDCYIGGTKIGATKFLKN